MFGKIGINKPESLGEWIGLTPLLFVYIIGAVIIASFPLCICFGILQMIAQHMGWEALANICESVYVAFAYIAGIVSGTVGTL